MTAPNARVAGGKKYFWDGATYASQGDAEAAQVAYERDGFETCVAKGDSPFLFFVYTRRVVKQTGDAKLN